jgi:hypothetical protein
VLSACDRYAGLGFAGFVLLHFAYQAARAHGDGAVQEPGLELQPAVVASLLLAIGLPFAVFAWRWLLRGTRTKLASGDEARALAVLESLTLCIILLFVVLHGAQIVWPLLSGEFEPSDVRPELIAMLSSTQHGIPMLAVAYLCGVGAAAFFGARQALRALSEPAAHARSRAFALVALFVLAWLLGSYAVIRCASGVILP